MLEPAARLSYLNWLAGGRKDPNIYIGYVFLFFYGLERRLMLDEPGAEAGALVDEVRRLLGIYGDNRSFRRYAQTLLSAAKAKLTLPVSWPPLSFSKSNWQLPLDLLVNIGRVVANGEGLTAEQMLNWYNSHPDKRLPIVAPRCPEEFLTLFKSRFAARYPVGVRVDRPKKSLSGSYRAASSTFSVDFKVGGADLPDVSGLTAPLNQLDPMIEACADDLSTYARLVGKDRSQRNLMAAAVALPSQLSNTGAAQPLVDFGEWISAQLKGDLAAINVQDLLLKIGGEIGPSGGIAKADMVLIANALARYNFGIEPDLRMSYPAPVVEDIVVVFKTPGGAQPSALSPEFLSALLAIDIGVMVANADGAIVLVELQAVGAAIARNANLSVPEKRRLTARIAFIAKHPPSGRALSRFKDLPAEQREVVSRLALAVAAADGIMAIEEVQFLEKLYKVLGLPAARLYSDIQALNTGEETLPIVAAADEAASIPVPARPKPAKAKIPSILNAQRLARTRADTAVVSSILGEIFKDDEKPAQSGLIVAKLPAGLESQVAGRFPGLDPKYIPLVIQVGERSSIARGDFEALAGAHSLLCDGAIEAINEWSFDKFDEPLFDDGPEIVINRQILEMVGGNQA